MEDKNRKLIEEHIKPAIVSKRILKAFEKVLRHEFVPNIYQESAYEDTALPIGGGQTISQPSLVAFMTQALRLRGNEKVLEVGTGSGYQSAILSRLAKEVYTIEFIEELSERASSLFKRLGFENIHTFVGDGTLGLPKYAPFDAIIVTAGGPKIPSPLIDKLKEGGRIVIPVGEPNNQKLILGIKRSGGLETEELMFVKFVALRGKYGLDNKD